MISKMGIIRLLLKQGIYAIILVAVVVGVTFGISYVFGTHPVVDVQAAESEERVRQVHLQQESMMQFYENTFQEEPSIIIPSGSDTVIVKGESIEIEDTSQEDLIVIIPSASDAINVSISVLQNLSLSIVDGQSKYATNWKFGATLHEKIEGDSVLIWTVTADY